MTNLPLFLSCYILVRRVTSSIRCTAIIVHVQRTISTFYLQFAGVPSVHVLQLLHTRWFFNESAPHSANSVDTLNTACIHCAMWLYNVILFCISFSVSVRVLYYRQKGRTGDQNPMGYGFLGAAIVCKIFC